MYNDKKKLEISIKQIEVELESLENLKKRIGDSDKIFLKLDIIDKCDRYGIITYTKKFLNIEKQVKCTHTKVYEYLKNLKKSVEEEISLLKKEKIKLERLILN